MCRGDSVFVFFFSVIRKEGRARDVEKRKKEKNRAEAADRACGKKKTDKTLPPSHPSIAASPDSNMGAGGGAP